MFDVFLNLPPVWQALIAGLFTWGLNAAGATTVFFKTSFSVRTSDAMMGFAAGVMIAASFWSLLAPAIDILDHGGSMSWLGAALGFLTGAIFIRVADRLLPHLHPGFGKPMTSAEGPPTA